MAVSSLFRSAAIILVTIYSTLKCAHSTCYIMWSAYDPG